ncbi:hypothetical protein QR680_006163 [Steinernema hermaphroditum]|uniref:Uncharacterized protein n=1 Tax=Steinernema hermaphroditum TaxID=289476 RepID=A0AA39LW30_9BILA|nr:hypothetical protein QR680_006163 [Steinernema hermaphroditum]
MEDLKCFAGMDVTVETDKKVSANLRGSKMAETVLLLAERRDIQQKMRKLQSQALKKRDYASELMVEKFFAAFLVFFLVWFVVYCVILARLLYQSLRNHFLAFI